MIENEGLNNKETHQNSMSWFEYLLVLIAVGVLYFISMAPGPLWQDNGLAQIRVLTHDYVGNLGLALSHPLFYLMGQFFQFLPFHESAFKTNLVAAVFGAFTTANVYLLLNRILIGSNHRRLAAVIGTLSLALAHTFWQHASLAEVYSVSTFVLTCELLALVKFINCGRVRWWLLVWFLNGVECSNHVLALLTLAVILVWSLFLFTTGKIKIAWILPAIVLWVVGCLPYEYLGFQAWRDGATIAAVIRSMLFGTFQSQVLNVHFGFRLVVMTLGVIALNFPTPTIFLIPVGWFMGKKFIDAGIFNFLLMATMFHFIFAMRYPVSDQYTFFIMTVFFMSLWAGIGAVWLIERWSWRAAVFLILFSLLPPAIYAAIPRYPAVIHRIFPRFGYAPIAYREEAKYFFWPWKTGYHGPDRLVKEVFATAGRNAIIIADDTSARPFEYYQLTKGQRGDVKIVSSLYGNLPVDQKVKKLVEELNQRQIWIVRPYPEYCPAWILNNFKVVSQGPLYQVIELEKNMSSKAQVPVNCGQDSHIKWIPANSKFFTVNGLYWFKETKGAFIRLPPRAEKLVTPSVWGLAQHPSGGRIRFKTDSTCLKLRIQHGAWAPLAMYHMCAVGNSGIDLYEGPPEKMTFWTSNSPGDALNPYVSGYFEKLPRTTREFTLYLPTYTSLASLEIGLDQKARVAPPSPFKVKKPMVFYGTSITQGGCASRGSNGFVPLVGRMLSADVVNLGFSGSGCGEPAMADFMSEVDASCYVIDSVANMSPELMKARYDKFVDKVRKKRPCRPILLMTRIRYSQENYAGTAYSDTVNKFVFETYNRHIRQGDKNIFLFDSTKVIGLGGNHPSVDGVHLTDLGFKILADALAPVLAKIIGPK